MNTETFMVRYYRERAAEYDRVYDKPERQEELRYLRGLLERLFAGAHVFEVACGTGYWAKVIARSAASIVATDINEETLAIARSKPILQNKAVFEVEDAYRLRKRSREFSAGLAMFWWSHVPRAKRKPFLQGFHRLFAPDSPVVFIDNNYVPGSSTPILRTDEQGDTFQMRHLQDGSSYEVLKNFPDDEDLRSVLDRLGSQVRIERLVYYWILSYVPAP
jgi:demethylmenaquinone methyltransferase/2-methoxy-6-polyprenyl-1,4-benzoquinol methylase